LFSHMDSSMEFWWQFVFWLVCLMHASCLAHLCNWFNQIIPFNSIKDSPSDANRCLERESCSRISLFFVGPKTSLPCLQEP
jgi:hypothetical protein